MPVINPGDNGYKPRDWRHAYDAFVKFRTATRTVAGRLGLNMRTEQWQLEAPGRFQGMADPRWKLTFLNLDKKWETIYVGSDAFTVRNTIKELHEHYIALLRARKPLSANKTPATQRSDPRFDHHMVQRMRTLWDQMHKARSIKEWEANVAANPTVVAFMKSRAGILPMSMQDYLYREPMSSHWPTPPRTQKEWDGRTRQEEDYQRTRERTRFDDSEEAVDDGPGWYG
jgi:hypothetical protein